MSSNAELYEQLKKYVEMSVVEDEIRKATQEEREKIPQICHLMREKFEEISRWFQPYINPRKKKRK